MTISSFSISLFASIFLIPSYSDIELSRQHGRVQGLLNGTIKQSRFATPEYVLRPQALILSTDGDPADVVIRRTRALYDDLNVKHNGLVKKYEHKLEQLENSIKNTPLADKTQRDKLYVEVCILRRKIAFSNPLLDFKDILFIKHKKAGFAELGGDHIAGQYYGINASKGEGLFVLENAFTDKPVARNIINDQLPDGAYLSPELSFDGNEILFAHTEAAGYLPMQLAKEDENGLYSYSGLKCSFTDKNAWHIYKVGKDGKGLTQLTNGVYNDFDPCYLPNGKIAFISDRRGGFGRCHKTADGGAPWFTYTLHRMNDDGSQMERLSHHETCEWQPSMMNNGMLVYTRWDYVDRGFFQAHHPWATFPDGRNALAIHGNYPKRWQDRPCAEMDIRAIPGSNNLVSVAIAHHGQSYGSIVHINPSVIDDDAMAPVKLITPDERLPESEYGYFCREASYATPYPLSEDYYLCVFGYPEDEPFHGMTTTENYGIYLLDAFGNIELIYRDPKISCLSPIPLKARPTPPVIPDMVTPYRVDLEQPRTNLDRPDMLAQAKADKRELQPGVVSIMDIYTAEMPFAENTKIKELRIIQVLPKSTPGRNNPAIGYATEKNARFVLGTVPVEDDGSVNFYLPPHIPVYFQAIDDNGVAGSVDEDGCLRGSEREPLVYRMPRK